jgi:hypothetical protein
LEDPAPPGGAEATPSSRTGEPLEEIQIDFKDVSSVPADPEGKQQHVVEVCNFVDAGTSLLLKAQPHPDFHAETALETVLAFLQASGCPRRITFDRDPRWVGSQSERDFPSAFCRMLLCFGIEPHLRPPRRPDLNGYKERLCFEGFGEIAASPCQTAFAAINHPIAAREHDEGRDAQPGLVLGATDHLVAVELREANIEHNQIGHSCLMRGNPLQCFDPVGKSEHLIALSSQNHFDDFPHDPRE